MDAASPSLSAAKDADVPAVAALMNMAFRGGGSDAGWTTEADHFQGNRTSEELLREDLAARSWFGGSRMACCSVVCGSSRRAMVTGIWAHLLSTHASRIEA